jgi:hypothetical protein
MARSETITISKCPICQGKHIYALQVERSVIIKMLTMNDLNERARAVNVTRIFVCPVKEKEFQATFALHDTSSDRIKSVDVEGIAEGDSDE